eukprot:TRINITY_DN11566_c0_g1_i1.p1 TRINITY_DN11566_c0_g1~~TRINITY_DN11566_c0_g1_i1.p1  ORF type:complete len:195 (-),score=37.51 TRINITY_DN11566_c0_g1_i1:248-832(-)
MFGNKSSICPVPGEPVDGRIVDTDCSVDKFETCLVHGPDGFCPSSGCQGDKLVTLTQFLACFEGVNHANFSALPGCASAAGIDLTAAHKCYADTHLKEKLWAEQLALKKRSTLQFFPTVLLDDKLMDANRTLVEDICSLFTGTKPAGCPSKPPPTPSPPPSNPCSGHRCDNGAACPCGCECGNDKDPGLCFVPQ